VNAGQVQREHHEAEPRSLRGPHHNGEGEQGGESCERVHSAEPEALVALEDCFGKQTKDSLAAAGAHHEDHAHAGKAHDHADDDVGHEDAGRLGAEDDGTCGEEQRHQDDEVDEPLGDDRAEGLAHRDVELLLGEVAAVDVAHLGGHDAIDKERGDHDPDQRSRRTILAGVMEQHVPADRTHHEGGVVHGEGAEIKERVRVTDVVPRRTPVDLRAPQTRADDDDGDAEGRDRFGGEEAARQ